MRAHHARVPDLGEARRAALAKGGTDRRLANLRLPVMDERPLEEPDEGFRAFIPEIMERRSRGVDDLPHAAPVGGLARKTGQRRSRRRHHGPDRPRPDRISALLKPNNATAYAGKHSRSSVPALCRMRKGSSSHVCPRAQASSGRPRPHREPPANVPSSLRGLA